MSCDVDDCLTEHLLPTRSEKREVFVLFVSIPVAILPSHQNMKIITLQLHSMNEVG